jgi:hypothetical protein
MDGQVPEDFCWDTIADSSDPPTSKDIVVAAREYFSNGSSLPSVTATVARQVMKINPMLIQSPDPHPETGESEPDEGGVALIL